MNGKPTVLAVVFTALLVVHAFRPVLAVEPRLLPGDATLLPDGEFLSAFENAIRNARHEVVVCTYLFIYNGEPENLPDRVAKQLSEAAARGVKIKVILERDAKDRELTAKNTKTGERLAGAGVKVVFDDPARKSHAKVAVVDRRLSFVGSHNLTDSALGHNRELSLMIESEETAELILRYLDGIAAPDAR